MPFFAEGGAGIFPSSTLIAPALQEQGLIALGTAGEVTESFYAISVERRLTHPAVRAISSAAPMVDANDGSTRRDRARG